MTCMSVALIRPPKYNNINGDQFKICVVGLAFITYQMTSSVY